MYVFISYRQLYLNVCNILGGVMMQYLQCVTSLAVTSHSYRDGVSTELKCEPMLTLDLVPIKDNSIYASTHKLNLCLFMHTLNRLCFVYVILTNQLCS